jgi:hypothetical protein
MSGRPWTHWRRPRSDWWLRQFIPTHSNLRNEWGTRRSDAVLAKIFACGRDEDGTMSVHLREV